MLKLVSIYDVDIKSIEEYYESYNKVNEYNSTWYIYIKDYGIEKFLKDNFYEERLYYLIDTNNPKYILGYGKIIDSKILDYHKNYLNTGQIAYEIRPEERKKGYATNLLKLLLLKCEELGMKEVCVSCKKDNVASKKVILKNNGKFEKKFYDDFEGYGSKYWIKLKPTFTSKIHRLIKRRN